MLSDQMTRVYKKRVLTVSRQPTPFVNLKSNTMKNTLQIYVK